MTRLSQAEFDALKARQKQAKPLGAKAKLQALGRLKTGELNKTEEAYAAHLEARKQEGEIAWYKFEGLKFRLADNTFYTPDFTVMLANGELEAHEVKGGFAFDDSLVKVKVAAAMYPFRFFLVRVRPKKEGGGWRIQEVGNGD